MKKSYIVISSIVALFSALAANAGISIGGTALLKVPNISVGDVSYFVIDENASGFANLGSINPSTSTFVPGTIYAGTAFTVASDNFGSSFTIVGSKTAASSFGSISVGAAYPGIGLANGVDSGDSFAIVVFETSTTSAVANDIYRIYTDPSWVIPADGQTVNFAATGSGTFLQLGTTATPAFTKSVASTTVIPEPSTYSALAGVAVLGLAGLRRRRA
jgi:hypothetical protein